MRAAWYEQTGDSDVIQIGERDAPEPGRGEVRVKVAFSGVNPTDWKSRSGATGGVQGDFQIPNQDGSGVIDAVGEGVSDVLVGQRVWVFFAARQRSFGTAAEYTIVPAEHAVPLPEGASLELGASLGIPAMTAHRCLCADGHVDGKTILVAGGAGAVGRSAIELARFLGAGRVIATVSNDEKAEIARAAGAGHTVNYKAEDAAGQLQAAAPDGIDRVVELSLGQNLDLDLAAAALHCVISSYANEGPNPELDVRKLMRPNVTLRFVLVYTMPPDAIEAAVRDITTALDEGALSEPPFHKFSLDQTAEAHDAVENGAVGKVLIEL